MSDFQLTFSSHTARSRRSAFLLGMLAVLLITSLACQAATNLPNPFATATPTITPSPTPTSTPTPTATPTPIPTGKVTEELPYGSTRFTDYDGKYELTFPPGWKTIDLGKDDISSMLDPMVDTNPGFQSALDSVKEMDPDTFRVMILDFNKGHYTKTSVTNVTVGMQTEGIYKTMPIEFLVSSTVEAMPNMIPGITIISNTWAETELGIEMGTIETNWAVRDINDQEIKVYQKMVMFQTDAGLIIVTFSSPLDLKDAVQADFNSIIESIRLLEQ